MRLTLRWVSVYAYQSCGRCGHVYLAPRPRASASDRLLAERLPDRVPEIVGQELRGGRARRRLVAELLKCLSPGSRVLEVGSGYGFLLADLREAGFRAAGIEPSVTGCRFATDWLGMRVDCAMPEEWTAPFVYDAVVADRSLEIVRDLALVLAQAQRWLRSRGILLVRWNPRLPVKEDAPLRRRAFTARTLEEVLRAHGFTEVRVRQDPWWRSGDGWATARV